MRRISVDIPVAATWPSRDELNARNAVIDELDAASLSEQAAEWAKWISRIK
jgi:hypothetical protein